MPSYAITGASRGIGWEFLRQISSDPNNVVIGIVRDKATTERKVLQELPGRPNIHILQADLVDYAALKAASADTARITGGGLDYLIANAGLISQFDAYDPIGVLGQQPEALQQNLLEYFNINVVGNIHLFNLFTPLILKGDAKKVIALSTGQADLDIIPKLNIDLCPAYAISKAGLNTAVAKFSAQYAKDGVLFMSICPGMVETGHFAKANEEQMKGLMRMLGSFKEYAPYIEGPATPEESVKDVLYVMDNASVEKGHGGSFLSHHGNKQWL
ncbi:NAD(P)-binding protein [Aspergillus steynii IBT 23096]|uniref:NAD(P)-binding protein n=1 Tax=Aspergillus steynii IBT 23096 TaxID=1392250 RepID=A0A2I2GA41_9EURO|nr:NAD(P)-binding protein [Aspergillus steynii IBT 23096]PLB49744.1 NAD(P)-binding protein [Aspergillus steynii IBT 23096]